MPRTFEEFLAFTAQAAPFTPKNYPRLARLEGNDRLEFCFEHSLRHIGKIQGQADTLLEAHDHGKQNALNPEAMTKLAMKALFNAFRLAELLGITAEEVDAFFLKEFPPRA